MWSGHIYFFSSFQWYHKTGGLISWDYPSKVLDNDIKISWHWILFICEYSWIYAAIRNFCLNFVRPDLTSFFTVKSFLAYTGTFYFKMRGTFCMITINKAFTRYNNRTKPRLGIKNNLCLNVTVILHPTTHCHPANLPGDLLIHKTRT